MWILRYNLNQLLMPRKFQPSYEGIALRDLPRCGVNLQRGRVTFVFGFQEFEDGGFGVSPIILGSTRFQSHSHLIRFFDIDLWHGFCGALIQYDPRSEFLSYNGESGSCYMANTKYLARLFPLARTESMRDGFMVA